MKPDILFIGSTTYDFLGRLEDEISPARLNELTATGSGFGGKAATAAVYCANLEVAAAYIGTVGNDFERIGHKKYLEERSVIIEDVFYTEQRTPLFFAFQTPKKEYAFFKKDTLEKWEEGKFIDHTQKVLRGSDAKIVYCAIGNMRSIESIFDIFIEAKVKNKKTAWNPIIDFFDQKSIEKILFETDLLLLNEDESKMFAKGLSLDFSEFYTTYGIEIICITLGKRGCDLYEKGSVTHISTIEVEIADAVGAGDAFAGTFLAPQLIFGSYRICAELACLAGSTVVQNLGAQVDSIPTLTQLLSLRTSFYET